MEKLNKQAELSSKLAKLIEIRDKVSLLAVLAEATGAGMNDFQVVKDASALIKKLESEERVIGVLKDAIASGNESSLRSALAEAGTIGLRSPEIGNAQDALSKLGARSEMRDKLLASMKSGNVDELASVLDEVDRFEGSAAFDADIKSARVKLDQLREEAAAADLLEKALSSDDINILKSAYDSAVLLHLADSLKYSGTVDKAKIKLKQADDLIKMLKTVESAIASKDTAAVESAMKKAREAGVTDAQIGDNMLKQADYLQKEAGITLSISEALKAKDSGKLAVLVQEAKALGISNDKVIFDVQIRLEDSLVCCSCIIHPVNLLCFKFLCFKFLPSLNLNGIYFILHGTFK